MISSTTFIRSALVIGASVGGRSASFSTSAAPQNFFKSLAESISNSISPANNQHVRQSSRKAISHITVPASRINGRENSGTRNTQWVWRNINGRATEEFAKSLSLHTSVVEGQKNQPNMVGGLLGGENPTEGCSNQLVRFKEDGIAGLKGIYFIRDTHFIPSTNIEDQKMLMASTVGCAAINAENSILIRMPVDLNSAPVFTELQNKSNVVMFVEADFIQLDEEDMNKVQILCAKTSRVYTLSGLREALQKGRVN